MVTNYSDLHNGILKERLKEPFKKPVTQPLKEPLRRSSRNPLDDTERRGGGVADLQGTLEKWSNLSMLPEAPNPTWG